MQIKGDAVKGLYTRTSPGNGSRARSNGCSGLLLRSGMLATDGGEALTDISSRLNDAQWGRSSVNF